MVTILCITFFLGITLDQNMLTEGGCVLDLCKIFRFFFIQGSQQDFFTASSLTRTWPTRQGSTMGSLVRGCWGHKDL